MRQTNLANGKFIERRWYVVDATDLVLGRMSTRIADVLTGKHKPTYTPHEDNGDFVIVINADKVKLTGDKLNKKVYYNHSGYIGGLRKRTAKEMKDKYPTEMVYRSIWGMITHNRLGRKQIKKLFIYAGPEHKHEAQQPVSLNIESK